MASYKTLRWGLYEFSTKCGGLFTAQPTGKLSIASVEMTESVSRKKRQKLTQISFGDDNKRTGNSHDNDNDYGTRLRVCLRANYGGTLR